MVSAAWRAKSTEEWPWGWWPLTGTSLLFRVAVTDISSIESQVRWETTVRIMISHWCTLAFPTRIHWYQLHRTISPLRNDTLNYDLSLVHTRRSESHLRILHPKTSESQALRVLPVLESMLMSRFWHPACQHVIVLVNERWHWCTYVDDTISTVRSYIIRRIDIKNASTTALHVTTLLDLMPFISTK